MGSKGLRFKNKKCIRAHCPSVDHDFQRRGARIVQTHWMLSWIPFDILYGDKFMGMSENTVRWWVWKLKTVSSCFSQKLHMVHGLNKRCTTLNMTWSHRNTRKKGTFRMTLWDPYLTLIYTVLQFSTQPGLISWTITKQKVLPQMRRTYILLRLHST